MTFLYNYAKQANESTQVALAIQSAQSAINSANNIGADSILIRSKIEMRETGEQNIEIIDSLIQRSEIVDEIGRAK